MSNVAVVQKTQKIVVNPAGSSVSVVNAGPQGPRGFTGTGGGGSDYDDEDAIAAIGAAIVAESGYLTSDVAGGFINLGLDQSFKDSFNALLNAKSLIQIKDTLTGSGNTYVNFPGGSGNYVSAPHAAGQVPSGNFSVVARIKMPTSAPGAAMAIATKYNATAAQCMFRLGLNTNGTLFFVAHNGTSGSTGTTTASLPFDGNWYWVFAARTSADGLVDFFYAADQPTLPTSWTNLTLNRSTFVGVLNQSATATFNAGAYSAGTQALFTGQISRILFFNALVTTGTPSLDMDSSTWTTGTTFADTHSNTFTLQGTASVLSGGTTAVSNTTSEFTLCETDAFPGIPVANHDSLLWSCEAMLFNTSGSAANFTPKLKVGGVDLFTWPAAISVASAASSAYALRCSVKISVNAADGTTLIATAQLIIHNAVTGTDAGSISMASNLANMGGNRTGTILTITSIPALQLRMTMGTAASTIGARALRSQMFLGKV